MEDITFLKDTRGLFGGASDGGGVDRERSERARERVRGKGAQSTRITFRAEVICVCGQRQSRNAGKVLEILLKVSGLEKSHNTLLLWGSTLKALTFKRKPTISSVSCGVAQPFSQRKEVRYKPKTGIKKHRDSTSPRSRASVPSSTFCLTQHLLCW